MNVMKRIRCPGVLSCILLCILWPVDYARGNSTTVIVRCSDDTGMPLNDVDVCLTRWSMDCKGVSAPNRPLDSVSSDSGLAWFRQIPPGAYRIRAGKEGFRVFNSDLFDLTAESLVRIEVRLVPLLGSLGDTVALPVHIKRWPFPGVISTIEETEISGSSQTIPELLETRPGILVQPETGDPMFPSLRSSDTGLYIDGIPLLDPADHRPGFFPPALFAETVEISRAGIDVDQVSSIGGNINVASPSPGYRSFTGMAGFSEIIHNESFIDTTEAQEAFDYWSAQGGDFDAPVDAAPQLSDQRYHLLLKSRTELAHFILAGEYRRSNRGYTSDYVSDESLISTNTWFKAARNLSKTATLSLTAGYQNTEVYPEYQWRIRGQAPLQVDRVGMFGAVEFRKRFGSTFWYDVLIASLDLSNSVDPEARETAYEYPYGLGSWTVDSERRVHSLVFKGGRITKLHAVETGIHFSWLDIDIKEGFQERDSSAASVSYLWNTDRSDYEFSLWGRDRWFMSEHLELGLGMRWDKFNYLEESDYLSPRFYGALNFGRQRFAVGVERIIQSPGMGFTDDDTVLPIDSETFNPVTEPQQGFRWFGSYNVEMTSSLKVCVQSHLSFLTRTVVTLPIETEPGIEFIMPVSADSGRNMGASVDAVWSPFQEATLSIGYGFNRTRLPWGENMKLSYIHPYPEKPWPRVFYRSEPVENMPLENELTHAVRMNAILLIPWVDARASLDYRWTSGLRYTRFYKDSSGAWMYDPDQINGETGDGVQRLDIDISRLFNLSRLAALECHLTVRNAFNSFQFPGSNPFTGEETVDPYRLDYNQPRTVSGSVFVRF